MADANPLRDSRFLRLFSAQVIALVGTGLSTVALTLLAYDLVGGDGLTEPSEERDGIYSTSGTTSGVVHNYMFSLGPAIAGGASNIQRNIIGERGLGLPRDPKPSA